MRPVADLNSLTKVSSSSRRISPTLGSDRIYDSELFCAPRMPPNMVWKLIIQILNIITRYPRQPSITQPLTPHSLHTSKLNIFSVTRSPSITFSNSARPSSSKTSSPSCSPSSLRSAGSRESMRSASTSSRGQSLVLVSK